MLHRARDSITDTSYGALMQATPIDPRDQTHEVDDPSYRVFFWNSPSHSDEWELTEADLDEVLGWIDQHSEQRPHSLWAVIRSDDHVTHVRLRGIDPPAPPVVWPPWAVEARP